MTMRIDSRDRLSFRDSLRDTRIYGRTVALLVPTFTNCSTPGCGYDAVQDSGLNPSCAECDGLGRTATWVAAQVYANIRNVDQALLTFGQAPPGAQVGSTFLTIGPRDKAMLDAVYAEKDAYILLDGRTFRPTSIEIAGVGQVEEYVILLASFQPVYPRPTGY